MSSSDPARWHGSHGKANNFDWEAACDVRARRLAARDPAAGGAGGAAMGEPVRVRLSPIPLI
ncbi:hypothetical protein J7E96_26805 [Streptomyces sp. ISL-96]|uniref:hypothetical protein n=1 Tax=Streptomyces sp. ISL-96 TaxID=2819191 RepID=UPI001BE976B7|nr:hypothetical protein [Streptomyces sp. ISL-96]MBT2492072.1 hypothetical protein [Streptomyces sp. ISL-96]